jgi:DNA-binding cell septation regulator SpoVG
MCGNKLGAVPRNEVSKFHVDVAHPVNPEAREMIERTIIESYLEELAEQKTRAASIPEIDRLSA